MPTVSVILPVYNGKRFLKEAIESILWQTFTDFEFIIINDGSTDGSTQIIASYHDNRIVHISNPVNKGLVYSLNKAIDFATGEFIARMDADDIAMPERLEKQVTFLKKNDIALLATRVKLIDENGEPLPDWKDDFDNITREQIKSFLVKDNCIAHPSVTGKTSIFKKYKYQAAQKYSEDYDLWLRMIADGLVIEKLSEPLLLYRILPASATRFKKINVFFRLAKVKFRFAWTRIASGKVSVFILVILLYACFDILKATGKEIKSFLKK